MVRIQRDDDKLILAITDPNGAVLASGWMGGANDALAPLLQHNRYQIVVPCDTLYDPDVIAINVAGRLSSIDSKLQSLLERSGGPR